MTTQHTPGQWEPAPAAVGYDFVVQDANGYGIANVASRIVEIGDSNAEGAANASLIAAAPDQFDACVDALSALEEAHDALNGAPYTVGLDTQITNALTKLRAAIAKAKITSI